MPQNQPRKEPLEENSEYEPTSDSINHILLELLPNPSTREPEMD